MLNCKIKVKNFKKLLDSLKGICTPEAEAYGRDCLKYIQLTIKQDSIVAIGCNGYQLSKYTLFTENESEFVCYFKPFYFRCFQWMEDKDVSVDINEISEQIEETEKHLITKACKLKAINILSKDIQKNYQMISNILSYNIIDLEDVSIEFNEETKEVSIKIPASFGRISYEFENKNLTYPDLSDTLENAKEKRKEGSIKFNPSLLASSSRSFLNGRNSYVELFMPQNDLTPMYCKARLGESELLEHIILPVRRDDV